MWLSEEMDLQDWNWKAFFKMPNKSSGFYFFMSFCMEHDSFPAYLYLSGHVTHSLSEVGKKDFTVTHVTWWRSTAILILFVIWCHRCYPVFSTFESLWIKIITHSPYRKTTLNTSWRDSSLVQVLPSCWPHLEQPNSLLTVVTGKKG